MLLEPERRRVRAKVERAGGVEALGRSEGLETGPWVGDSGRVTRFVRSGNGGPET